MISRDPNNAGQKKYEFLLSVDVFTYSNSICYTLPSSVSVHVLEPLEPASCVFVLKIICSVPNNSGEKIECLHPEVYIHAVEVQRVYTAITCELAR